MLVRSLAKSLFPRHIQQFSNFKFYSAVHRPIIPRKRRKKLPFVDFEDDISAQEAVNNIIYNNPETTPSPITRHILNCLVSNEPGVLSRVSGVLAGRGFNIDSLVVAKTEVADLSRMTIVLNGQSNTIEQAKKQLEDLVPVWAVLDYTHGKTIEKELLMVKVWTVPLEHLNEATEMVEDSEKELASINSTGLSPLLASSLQRQALNDLCRMFKGKVVDVSVDSMVIELCAKPSAIDSFLKLLKPYGVIEATRSGVMAMPRSPVDGMIDPEQSVSMEEYVDDGKVDATMLPPG